MSDRSQMLQEEEYGNLQNIKLEQEETALHGVIMLGEDRKTHYLFHAGARAIGTMRLIALIALRSLVQIFGLHYKLSTWLLACR